MADEGLINVVKFVGDASEVREEMRKTKEDIGRFQKEINDSGPNAQAKKVAEQAEKSFKTGSMIGNAIRSSILGLVPELTLLYAGIQGITAAFERMRDSVLESVQAMYHLRETSVTTREMLSQRGAGAVVGESSGSIMQGLMSWSQGTIDLRYGFGSAAQSLRMIGVAAKDAKGDLKSVTDLMIEVQKRLDRYSPADRALIARNIFGNTAQASMVLSGVPIGQQQAISSLAGLTPSERAFGGMSSLGAALTLIGQQLAAMLQHMMSVIAPAVTSLLTVASAILAVVNHVLRAIGYMVNLIAQNASGGMGMLAGGIAGGVGIGALLRLFSGGGIGALVSSVGRLLGGAVRGLMSGGVIGAVVGAIIAGLGGSLLEKLFSNPNKQGNQQRTPGQLANMGGFGPNSAGLMGIAEYARQTLVAGITASNIPYDQLVELRAQTRLLQQISLNAGGLVP